MSEKFPQQPSSLTVFTTAQVAEILQVSRPTVRGLKESGELEALEGMRVHRYPAASLLAYLNRNKSKK